MSENLINEPVKKNFDFIDSIRCLGMMFIVFEHSVHVGTYIFDGVSLKNLVYMSLVQIPKAGTILFFIIAGFLLGSKFQDYTPAQYFKRRVATTVLPWLIWSLVFVFTMSYKFVIIMRGSEDYTLFHTIGLAFKTVYLYSNYWFIINFLICIGILLLFRKYLYSKWLGLIFFLFTLIYSINIHFEWFFPLHTMAIFGFVFFLWLGAQLNKNWTIVKQIIDRIPNWLLFLLFVGTFALSIYELAMLYQSKSIDPYNTLRFSNILYSLVCALILFKVKNFKFATYFRPRETTYGIFLIHYILVFNLLPEILRPFHITPTQNLSIIWIIVLSLARFITVYSLTYAIVYGINRTKYKWLIGR